MLYKALIEYPGNGSQLNIKKSVEIKFQAFCSNRHNDESLKIIKETFFYNVVIQSSTKGGIIIILGSYLTNCFFVQPNLHKIV